MKKYLSLFVLVYILGGCANERNIEVQGQAVFYTQKHL
jgi:uncharacterized protein YcfL